MKSLRRKKNSGQPALDLLEEAVALLRSQPLENLFFYYLGAIPFALGLVYYWADMSGGALAREHLAGGALGLALLWVWMKCWQAVYAERLKSWIMQVPPSPLSPGRLLRTALAQAATSPWGFVLLPVSMVLTIPLGWCTAFFQNLTVLDRGDGTALREQVRAAWQQALLRPRQNHLLLMVIGLLSCIVCLNILIALMMLPQLLKTLLGIESIFGMSAFSMVNSTLWVIIGVLTYLCLDPLVKTAYVLRCYQGGSLHTGEDLLTDLRISLAAKKALMVFLLVCGALAAGFWAAPAQAEDAGAAHKSVHSAEQLDRAIEKEMSRLEYSWRMPREAEAEEEQKESGFFRIVVETVEYWVEVLGDGFEAFFEWLGELLVKMFPKIGLEKTARHGDSADRRFVALYLLLGVAACMAALVAWRHLQRKKNRSGDQGEGIPLADIDLESDEVKASDLPTDQWLALARDLLQKGERRLALRALYLADLAGLAGAQLVTIARAKSDSDYQRELTRRGLAGPETVEAFSQNITIFQQAWYGMREVSEEMFCRFEQNHQRIMAHVDAA